MGRRTVTRWVFAAGLCVCGCTAPRSFSPFNWTHSSDAATASSTPDKTNPLKPAGDGTANGDSTVADKDSSQSADSQSADSKTGDSKPGDSKTSAAGAPAKNGYKTVALDPELRKKIDEELAYEPAEERQRLFNQWTKFDPTFIRELVENHRMARETAENHQQPIKLASADTSQDRDSQATPIVTSPTPGSSSQSPGAVSPWSDPSDVPALPGRLPPASASPSSGPPSSASPAAASPAVGRGQSGGDAFDAFDAPGGTGQPGAPISIARPSQPATAATKPVQTDTVVPAANMATVVSSVPKTDPFAGMAPVQDEFATTGPTPGATPPATPGTPPAAGGPASSSAAKPAVAGPTPAPSNSPAPDSSQPVQLQPPTDVPPGTAVASATTDPTKPSAAGAVTPAAVGSPAPNGAGSGTPSSPTPAAPSGLAGLGNRLMGVINPSSVAAARNALASANWHDELQRIVAAAAGEAGQTSVGTTDAEKLKYVEKQVHLRMLYLLSGQPAKSLEPISGLDAPDQEFWQQVFWGMSNYFDKTAIADPSDRATQTITQLRTAVHRLQEKSKLELRNVAFCQKIVNYGNYERLKRDEFTPGQLVLLYAEVENFKSDPTPEGPYRTVLKSTIEIFDSRGQSVQSMPFPSTDDVCANPRRDYYNSYEFAIPQRIGLGPHTLKLTVEDQISRKLATYTVNFTVK